MAKKMPNSPDSRDPLKNRAAIGYCALLIRWMPWYPQNSRKNSKQQREQQQREAENESQRPVIAGQVLIRLRF